MDEPNLNKSAIPKPNAHRILLIRPSALGDVSRTVPVLASLRKAYPDARIDWMVQQGFEAVVEHHPDLSNVVPFDRHGISRSLKRLNPMPYKELVRRLREPGYDLVIDAQGLLRTGWFSRTTGSGVRVGHADAREKGSIGYTHKIEMQKYMHTVDRMLGLVEAIGIEPVRDMRLYTDPGERQAVATDARFADRYVVFAPTSRWKSKQWPAGRFAELSKRILAEGLTDRIVVVGGAGERKQCTDLLRLAKNRVKIIDLVGETSIARLMAIIERAQLVVANDSAALHIAVGLDRPIVALYGPTDIGLVGPYMHELDVIQHIEMGERLDHKDETLGPTMMRRITVHEVLEACALKLAHHRAGR